MKTKSVIWLIIILLVLSLALFAGVQYSKIMDYDYKIKGIKFDVVGLNKTKGTIDLSIVNKSDLSAEVLSMDLDLYMNGVFVSKLVNSSDAVQINANSAFSFALGFEFSPNKILSIKNIFALEGIANPEKVKIGLYGKIKTKKGFFSLNIPLSLNESLSWYL